MPMDINDKIVIKDKDFNTIPIQEITFSDGAKQLKIDPKQIAEVFVVSIDPQCPINQIPMYLALLNTILVKPYGLHIPYFPYARADRIFDSGASFGLQAFVGLINWCMVDSLCVSDIHNLENLQKLIPTVKIFNLNSGAIILERVIQNTPQEFVYLVAPDKGAINRTLTLYEDLDLTTPIIECSKTRDVKTGKITSFYVKYNEPLTGATCILIDDICDAGGTFIPLAKKLKEKGAKKVILYVTHGIFSKKLQPFGKDIDEIYCMFSIGDYVTHKDIGKYNSEE